ncbi:hypothetical protein HPP92_015692 [Vanilla planifolia]|uniref:Uncharacterized protein n=1 Tax=Vanilla planifolia TaxID=51239 RepID=A0A835QP47_VANPL|nr:hypothetical protein HPP92_015692 [Vanilla planifolia]
MGGFSRCRELRKMMVMVNSRPPMGLVPKAFLCSTTSGWEGGVSMVQGASRGLGLEFVRQLLEKNSKGHVIASCRNPGGATGLLELKGRFEDRLAILPLDVTNESTIKAAATSIKQNYGSLNLLINTSGILSIPNVLHPVQKQL